MTFKAWKFIGVISLLIQTPALLFAAPCSENYLSEDARLLARTLALDKILDLQAELATLKDLVTEKEGRLDAFYRDEILPQSGRLQALQHARRTSHRVVVRAAATYGIAKVQDEQRSATEEQLERNEELSHLRLQYAALDKAIKGLIQDLQSTPI